MKKSRYKYNITEEQLNTLSLAGWEQCRKHLPKFAAFMPLYTNEYIDKAIENIRKAEKLTAASHQSKKIIKETREDLVKATKQMQQNWQMLKAYIIHAYPTTKAAINLKEAGSTFYKKVSAENWTSMRSFEKHANHFIVENFIELTANGNMPTQFRNTFKKDSKTCIMLATKLAKARMDKQEAVNRKIQENNITYQSLVRMLRDGVLIFRNNETIKKQFTFSNKVTRRKPKSPATNVEYSVNEVEIDIRKVA